MARSRRMRRWWAENRPPPPAALADEQAELADVDALWRWTRALMRDALGQRHRPAFEPQISAQLLENWRECMRDLVDVAGLDGSMHPLDVAAAAGYVREWLRHELGHRPRWPRSGQEGVPDYAGTPSNIRIIGRGRHQVARGSGCERSAVGNAPHPPAPAPATARAGW